MKITAHGAAGGEVTGSAYLVETPSARVLIDFGMFHGVDQAQRLNRVPRGLNVERLDAVLVTHAHLDHCGRLPLLVKAGYQGPVFATSATRDLCDLILRDSAKVQAQDIERTNRRRLRAGKEPIEPLYGVEEVAAVIDRFREVPYQRGIPVAPGIEAAFVEAGHMLGSASIRLTIDEAQRRTAVVFSGDLGPKGAPILKDAEPFHAAHAVFMESTYGGHNHKPLKETIDEFVGVIRHAIEHRGKILVPTFAVGRAQLLLYVLAWAFRRHQLPKFPLYLDSPMAIEATRIYNDHPELFDDELLEAIEEKPLQEDLDTLHTTPTAEQSKALNSVPGPCLIMAGAGMCHAGRILHHLRQNLWKPETHVIFVGFQAPGTTGRQLVDGKKFISIFGERIAVKGRIHTMGGFSAHAGQQDLLDWFNAMAPSRPRVFLIHGEARSRRALANQIHTRHSLRAELPELGTAIEL